MRPGTSGRLLVALALALVAGGSARPAVADAAGWGRSVRVGPEREALDDVVAVRGDAHVEPGAHAAGDVVVACGDAIIAGRVDGDVIAVVGRVVVQPGGIVGGDVLVVGGGAEVQPGAFVGGQARSLLAVAGEGRPGYLDVAFSPGGILVRLAGVLLWTVAALAAAFIAPSAVVRAAAEVTSRPARTTLIGAVLHVILALTFVLFVALVVVFVGIPLLALLVLAGLTLEALALAASFHALGGVLAERLHDRAMSGYANVLLGALLVGAAQLVPDLGELVMLCACWAGAGAVLASWRRTPRLAVR